MTCPAPCCYLPCCKKIFCLVPDYRTPGSTFFRALLLSFKRIIKRKFFPRKIPPEKGDLVQLHKQLQWERKKSHKIWYEIFYIFFTFQTLQPFRANKGPISTTKKVSCTTYSAVIMVFSLLIKLSNYHFNSFLEPLKNAAPCFFFKKVALLVLLKFFQFISSLPSTQIPRVRFHHYIIDGKLLFQWGIYSPLIEQFSIECWK